LASSGGSTVNFQTDNINGAHIHNLTNAAILSPKNKENTKISDLIMNTLIQDYSRTYYSGDSVDYGDKSPKQLYPIEFPNSLSPSGLPPHRLNLKINTVVMLITNLNASEGLANSTQKIVKLARAPHNTKRYWL
jgi:hypothetical protein